MAHSTLGVRLTKEDSIPFEDIRRFKQSIPGELVIESIRVRLGHQSFVQH